MTGKTTVVTPKRYSEGYTYPEYLDQIKVNKPLFQLYYQDFDLDPAAVEQLRTLSQAPGGPAKVLALGEDWCPDVYRGLPTVAKLADASNVEIRVFPRDSNVDVMDEFLKDGKFQSIPTFVFYTKDMDYICHWIEKPAVAERESQEIEAAIRAENPGIDDRQFGVERRKRVNPRFPAWQHATIVEINEMLEKALAGK
jgi:thiol-disulfide isomerase/thioredoxin